MHQTAELMIYKNEPLMCLITRCRHSNPISLGVAFFVMISMPLTIWAVLSQTREQYGEHFVTFLHNISWSVSIIYLFPFIIALTLKYYQAIPELFQYLFARLQNPDEEKQARFFEEIGQKFNDKWSTGIILFISITLNFVYFYQTLNDDMRWLSTGTILQNLLHTKLGFSPVGFYAQIIQIFLIYWILVLIWKGFVFAWALHRFFKSEHHDIVIDPLHPDDCCGLKPIGNVASILNLILFLIGFYLSLRVIDKILFQNSHVFEDIGNPMMLGGYLILAPLLFFLPLRAAHKKMLEVKQAFILPVSKRCEQLFQELGEIKLDKQGHETISSLEQMEKMCLNMERIIPVWPFDFKNILAFLGTIIVPLLPVILPFLIQFLMGES